MRTNATEFINQFGKIPVGSKVRFSVENVCIWSGDLVGILKYDKEANRCYIQTKNSGKLTIDQGYDVYGNTIDKIEEDKDNE